MVLDASVIHSLKINDVIKKRTYVLADTGYCSNKNHEIMDRRKINGYYFNE